MHPLLFPPALIKRALDDLSAIADAARSLPRMEAELLASREAVEQLREEMLPIQELPAVREGIAPLDEDMRSVRDSVDGLEPLLGEVNRHLAGLEERIETLRADLAPLGELADKLPGVGR